MTHKRGYQLARVAFLTFLLSSVAACKTIENAATRAVSTTDETFTGKFVTVAEARKLAIDNANGGSRMALVGGDDKGPPNELPNSKPLADYAQEVLTRVLAGYPYPLAPIQVQITRETGFEAYATPAGNIEIPQGLLVNIESEDELAFVLAHEAAHILLNHHTQEEIVKTWSGARALGAGVGLEVTKNLGSELAKQTGQKWITAAFLAAELIDKRLLAPAWRRSQEEEADLLGLDLLVAAGYNLDAAQFVFERSADQEEKSEKKKQKAILERESAIRALQAQGKVSEAMDQSLKAALNEPIKALLIDKEGLSAEHPTAKSREDLNVKYVYREYREVGAPPLLTTRYRNRALTGAAGQALTREVNLLRADGLLEKREFTKAADVLISLLKDPRDTSLDVREGLYKIYSASGDPAKAAEQLEFAINDPAAKEPVYEQLIGHYKENNVPAKELAAIDRLGRKSLAKEESLTPRRIQLLYQMGRIADGDRIAQQCDALGERRLDIVVQCRAIVERRRAPQS